MKEFYITGKITFKVNFEVEAENEEEALKIAKEEINDDYNFDCIGTLHDKDTVKIDIDADEIEHEYED